MLTKPATRSGKGKAMSLFTAQAPKPENGEAIATREHLEYLDDLGESGATNMFSARPYLQKAFPELSGKEAADILLYWMESFGDRHPQAA
jgi:hypothetical protein